VFSEEQQDGFMDLPFTPEELSFALSNVLSKSSPGLDNIDYVILKKLTPLAKCILLHIYNSILREAIFPVEWSIGT
jgi:hypothetical protein